MLEKCTNNQAEYQALIKGLEKYHELGLKYNHLTICGDSKLVILQLKRKVPGLWFFAQI